MRLRAMTGGFATLSRMTDHSSRVAALLHEAGETHHLVYRIVDLDKDYATAGPEVPWPQWYAERILEQFGVRRSS